MSVRHTRARSIVRFGHRPAAALRLVCVPGAGDRPNLFRSWAGLLPDFVEVCALQLPGHGARMLERPIPRLAELVDTLAGDLIAELPGPIAILGHSMGALIGYELAHALGPEYVRHLIVAAYRAPDLPSRYPPAHALDDAELVRWVDRLGGSRGGLGSDPELLSLVLPVLRADFALCEGYEHRRERPLAVPVTALGGREDWFVNADELSSWGRHTSAAFACEQFPGGHFFLGDPPGPDLIRAVGAALADGRTTAKPTS